MREVSLSSDVHELCSGIPSIARERIFNDSRQTVAFAEDAIFGPLLVVAAHRGQQFFAGQDTDLGVGAGFNNHHESRGVVSNGRVTHG